VNKWFAECVPCKWRTAHDNEDAAIAAAEEHVGLHHAKVAPLIRAQQRIGHVQLRGEDAVGYEFSPGGVSVVAPVGVAGDAATPGSEPALPPTPAAAMLPGDSDPTGTQ
jgi:hypothetical protein